MQRARLWLWIPFPRLRRAGDDREWLAGGPNENAPRRARRERAGMAVYSAAWTGFSEVRRSARSVMRADLPRRSRR